MSFVFIFKALCAHNVKSYFFNPSSLLTNPSFLFTSFTVLSSVLSSINRDQILCVRSLILALSSWELFCFDGTDFGVGDQEVLYMILISRVEYVEFIHIHIEQ